MLKAPKSAKAPFTKLHWELGNTRIRDVCHPLMLAYELFVDLQETCQTENINKVFDMFELSVRKI